MVPRKAEELLPGSGGVQDGLGLDEFILSGLENPDLLVFEDKEDGAVGPNGQVRVLARLLGQLAADLIPPCSGVGVFDGTEELMGLEDQLPTQLVLVVHDQSLDPESGHLQGGGEAGGTTADDENGDLDLLYVLNLRARDCLRETRKAIHAFNDHVAFYGGHTGFDGKAVGQNEALGALPVGAEDTLTCTVLVVVTEDLDPVGHQGRRDHLSLTGLHGRLVPVEDNL